MKYLHDIPSTGWFLYPSFHLPFSTRWPLPVDSEAQKRHHELHSNGHGTDHLQEAGQKPMDFDNPWMNGSYFNG